ncbi:unnamed protein product, partial [Vitis vinifera]
MLRPLTNICPTVVSFANTFHFRQPYKSYLFKEQSQFRKGKDWHYIGHIPHREIFCCFCFVYMSLN